MGGCLSKQQPPALLGEDVPHCTFEEVRVTAEHTDEFIAQYQEDLRELMTSAAGIGRNADRWQEEQCPTVQGMRLWYGYTAAAQGPHVVTTYTFAGIDPDALFRWLTSVEGFKIIDPDTKNHERPPVETLQWRDRAFIAYALAPPTIPFMHARTFIALNAMDHKERLFISAPVLHDEFPKEKEAAKKQIRARNVWASWIHPVPGGARMLSFCWIAMNGTFPAHLTDSYMRKKFMQDFHTRLIQAVKNHPELRLGAGITNGKATPSVGSQPGSPAGPTSIQQGQGAGPSGAGPSNMGQAAGPSGVRAGEIQVGHA